MNKKIIYTILLSIFSVSIFAQINLVPNSSFEVQTPLVDNSGQLIRALPWQNPALGTATPDIFHAASINPICRVPLNSQGFENERTGQNAFSGIWSEYCFGVGGALAYREYVQVRLNRPLIAGQVYDISFWMSVADSVSWGRARLGILLTQNRPTQPVGNRNIDGGNPTLFPATTSYYEETPTAVGNRVGWTHVVFEDVVVTADCLEWLTIGNFNTNANAGFQNFPDLGTSTCGSYVYIDDVEILDPRSISFSPNQRFVCTGITPTFTQVITPTITGVFDRFEWYKDGVLIAGATGTTYTTSDPGIYEIRGIVNSTAPCPTVYSATFSIYTSNTAYTLDYTPTLCNPTQTFNISFPSTLVPTPTVTWAATNATNPTGTGFSYTPNFIDASIQSQVTMTITYFTGCTHQQTIPIYPCCVINNLVSQVNTTATALLTQDIDGDRIIGNDPDDGTSSLNAQFEGTLTIDQNITIDGFDMKMNAMSQIIVLPGNTLTLRNGNIYSACNIMWKGILLKDNTARVVMSNNCLIEDAIEGINSTGGGVYDVRNTIFNRCHIGIKVNRYTPTHTGIVQSTEFLSEATRIFRTAPVTLFTPHLGERGFIGIDIDRANNITIGERGAMNTFSNMNYGIRTFNTRATIRNNTFNSMFSLTGDANSGTGIYMRGTNDAFAYGLGVSLIGTNNSADRNNFNTPTTAYSWAGIISEGLSITIENNIINRVIRGVTIRNTNIGFLSASHINILANQFRNIYQFGLGTAGIGINDNNNTWTNLTIRNNVFVNPSISTVAGIPYSNTIGIFSNTVLGALSSTRDISGNSFTQFWKGISMTRGGSMSNIENNSISMNTTLRSPSADGVGIELINTTQTAVECNNVVGTSRTRDISISLNTSASNIVRCNTTGKGINGLRIFGPCNMPNSIYGNTFSEHYDYIFLTNNGRMGDQLQAGTISPTRLPGNRFLNTTGYRAKIRTSNGGVTGNSYRWNSFSGPMFDPNISNTDGTGTLPAVPVSILTIPISSPLLNYACPSPTCAFSVFALRMAADEIATDEAIDIANATSMEAMTEEQIYEAEKELYKDLETDPTKYEEDAILDEFKEDYESTDAYKLIEATEAIANKEYEEALLKANEVAVPSVLPQALMKEVIILQTDTIVPDTGTSKYIALMDIATTCPTIGGEAVFIARSELMKYYDYIDWDDMIICNPETATEYSSARRANPHATLTKDNMVINEMNKNTSISNNADLLIFPNPASDFVSIHSLNESNLIKVEFIDINGNIAKSYTTNSNNKIHTIETKNMTKGLYLINCIFDDGSIKTLKITII